ncbi:hypothetical protein PsorP6_013017 [Peronosclerospora sorghi]|uniref:Uncharacterized protein n=1 Tax=Peronosclerospora sorghi TaxID=230839 RepID=A0ACC0WHW9_9STRA|nr:hypothetical protein PsorP6_013017 [Peronosclerospora sorghi]
MRGSGLSIERFIKGKAQRAKSDGKSKKQTIIRKAQRRREYEKVKKREGSAFKERDESESAGGPSFYDRFFSELKSGKDIEHAEQNVEAGVNKQEHVQMETKRAVKPDPFFKAKKKAAITKMQKLKARENHQKRIAAVEKKIVQRKKRHVKLSQRTVTGQPIVKNHINDILARLQAEKKREGE